MMSNHNSPEFKTIIQCTPVLTTAVKNELTQLSGELLAEGLIADDNAANLRNQFIGAAERAAQLVGYVRNRVSLDTGNYHTFIGVLEKRRDDHTDILKKLNEKFGELGGNCPPPKLSDSHKYDHASGSTRSGAGISSPSLKRSTESDCLQHFYATLNSSITDPDMFAAKLIQCEFTTRQTADNKMPLGIPNYRKVGNLLGIVDSHIRSISSLSPGRVKERFLILLSILHELGHHDIAQKMETECYGSQQLHATANRGQVELNGAMADPSGNQESSASSSNDATQCTTFSENMSPEEFKSYLIYKGVCEKDSSWLIENGINAKAFPHLKESHIKSDQFKVNFGGKLILETLLQELSKSTQP